MSTADPRTSLTFASKVPYTTNWLEVEAPADAEPTAMYAELAAAGWVEQRPGLPPHMAYDQETFKPLGYQVVERTFFCPGSDHFQLWKKDEAKKFMAAARAILARYGFTRVPVWRKTLQDML